jgi:signal transduction histidine kinase/ActR/RegA family two-component response regulator
MVGGAADYLVKDRLNAERLERTLRYAAERWRLETLLRRSRQELQVRVTERTIALETMNAALAAEVTERRRAEHALREVDRRKNEFLATLAHELRNPLAPIRHAAEILARAGEGIVDPARDVRARKVIERQVAHLVRLIDDLLDLSRITHGKLDLRCEWVPLAEIVESALETVQPLLTACDQEFEAALPEEPLMLYGDPVRLVQILLNLLSNAAKYTGVGGRIRLEASRKADSCTVRVIDTGIGIPASELEYIFTMFGQAPRVHDFAHGGLGIGLALAKQLTELHGGTLTAASKGAGKGSVFTLWLPLTAAQDAAKPEALVRLKPKRPLRILIADDNKDAAITLSELLRLDGHETFVAHDGPSAVEVARKEHPDVAILDIGLPGFDGHEVARRLRADPALAGLFLVALSGWVQPDDLARSRQVGFNHHVAKPVDLATIERLLAQADGSSRTHSLAPRERGEGAQSAGEGSLPTSPAGIP